MRNLNLEISQQLHFSCYPQLLPLHNPVLLPRLFFLSVSHLSASPPLSPSSSHLPFPLFTSPLHFLLIPYPFVPSPLLSPLSVFPFSHPRLLPSQPRLPPPPTPAPSLHLSPLRPSEAAYTAGNRIPGMHGLCGFAATDTFCRLTLSGAGAAGLRLGESVRSL